MAVADLMLTPQGESLMDVLVVDDHRVVADAIAARLRLESDIDRVTTAASVADALEAAERLHPDVATVDPQMESGEGIALIRRLREADPSVQVVVVAEDDDPEVASEAVRAGALAFVLKDAPSQDLVEAVRGTVAGEAHIPPRVLHDVLQALRDPDARRGESDARIGRLTRREREVLEHMVAGHDRATTARDLYVSVNTVRTHAKNILAKLEVHSTLEAVGVALSAGIRPPTHD